MESAVRVPVVERSPVEVAAEYLPQSAVVPVPVESAVEHVPVADRSPVEVAEEYRPESAGERVPVEEAAPLVAVLVPAESAVGGVPVEVWDALR